MQNYIDNIYNSRLEVDLGALSRNVSRVRAHIGSSVDIMPVLKGNAYAAGLPELARWFYHECGVKILACAQVFEAAQMRAEGVDCDILIMGGLPYNNIPAAVHLDVTTPGYSIEYLRLLDAESQKQGKRSRVHIKIETGLNRIGVRPGEALDKLCAEIKSLKNIEITGAFTHFAESESPDRSFTLHQMRIFNEGAAQLRSLGFELQFVHAFNTASICWMRDPAVTHIRAAGIFMGYDTCLEPVNALGLEEVLSWRAFVTDVKTVPAGETIGYNRHFKAIKPTRAATVSVGYGDGYARHLAMNCGAEMLVCGKRVPVIGFCMDQCFIDIGGLDVKMNDTVTLLGRDGDQFISVFELQKKMGQTYLSTVSVISPRVKRVYVGGHLPERAAIADR